MAASTGRCDGPRMKTQSARPQPKAMMSVHACLLPVMFLMFRVEAFAFLQHSSRHRLFCRPSLLPRASAAINDTLAAEKATPITETQMTVPMEHLQDADEFDVESNNLPAKTLHGRLLCAAQCAYNKSVDSPYFMGAGYLPGSTTVQVTLGVNSVFIGQTVDGIVLAFRGTKTWSPLDWLQNAAILLQRVNKKSVPGRIHAGFYRAVRSIWKPIKSIVMEMINDTAATQQQHKNIYMTGHSKGGAMASIAAILFDRDDDLPNVTQVVTFASAKVGDSAFANAYNKEVNQISYEYYLDIVPFLPPSQATMDAMGEEGTAMMEGVLWNDTTTMEEAKEYVWDYQPVGKRRYIDSNINILKNVTRELDDARIRDIEEKTLLSLKEFAAAHCLTCPSEKNGCKGGYFAAVAEEVCQQCCSNV